MGYAHPIPYVRLVPGCCILILCFKSPYVNLSYHPYSTCVTHKASRHTIELHSSSFHFYGKPSLNTKVSDTPRSILKLRPCPLPSGSYSKIYYTIILPTSSSSMPIYQNQEKISEFHKHSPFVTLYIAKIGLMITKGIFSSNLSFTKCFRTSICNFDYQFLQYAYISKSRKNQ